MVINTITKQVLNVKFETMNFKQFKDAVSKKCKERSACSYEFKKLLESKNYKELIGVLTDNFSWCCQNDVFTISAFSMVDKKHLNDNDLYINQSTDRGCLFVDSATVEAYGSATVEAYGSATVKAYGSATVEAWGSATVKAYGSATVEAYDSATVEAFDSATVEAYGSATVEAWGSAYVEAYGSATVEAWCSAYVEAWCSATVKAWGSAYVCSYNKIEHKLSEKAICRYYYEDEILVSEETKIKKY